MSCKALFLLAAVLVAWVSLGEGVGASVNVSDHREAKLVDLSRYKKVPSVNVLGAEVIPGTTEREVPARGAHNPKREKPVHFNAVGAEVIPRSTTQQKTVPALSPAPAPALGPNDKKNCSIHTVGSEVIPGNSSECDKDGKPRQINVLGSEVIPAGATDSSKTSTTKAPKHVPVNAIKAAGLLNVTGSEVIPVSAIQSNKSPPGTASRPSNIIPTDGTSQIPPVKAPRESSLPRGKVPQNKVTANKGGRGPCKEGLGKDLCSFQYRPGGRRHLMTPEVLQRYLTTGWAPLPTPTKEVMYVCCDGKVQIIGFVGRDAREEGAGSVANGNTENIMNKEVKKLKKKLGEIEKNYEKKQ